MNFASIFVYYYFAESYWTLYVGSHDLARNPSANALKFLRRVYILYHFQYILAGMQNIGRQIREMILAEGFNFFRVSED